MDTNKHAADAASTTDPIVNPAPASAAPEAPGIAIDDIREILAATEARADEEFLRAYNELCRTYGRQLKMELVLRPGQVPDLVVRIERLPGR